MVVILLLASVLVAIMGGYRWNAGLHFHAVYDWVLASVCLVLAVMRDSRQRGR